MLLLENIIYSLVWFACVYGFNCAVARSVIKISPLKLAVYMLTMAAIGLSGEIIFDTIYKALLGSPMWLYRITPIHHAYTSIYSVFLWGAVGFHLYLLHDTLIKKNHGSVNVLALIFWLEALALEVLVNLTYLLFFNSYLFYYLPNDLWHLTSLEALPGYLIAAFASITIIEYFKKTPRLSIAADSAIIILLFGARF